MTDKLTLKVTKLAYYKNALVYPNEIIKGYVGEVPTWATLANGKDVKDEEKNTGKPENEGNIPTNDSSDNEKNQEGKEKEAIQENQPNTENNNSSDVKEKTDAELQAELEALLNEGIEKNIIIEDADKKTVAEQIAEMKKLLGKE